MSWWVSLCFYPVWDPLHLFHIVEIFNYNLFKHFLIPFLFIYFFWDPYNLNIGAFDIVPEVFETISVLFILLTLFCSSEVISTISSSSSLICFSASQILLLVPSRVFLISVILLFVSVVYSLILILSSLLFFIL